MMAKTLAWQQAEEALDPYSYVCPLCMKRMEILVFEENGVEYVEAERCKPCGWEWRDGRARRI